MGKVFGKRERELFVSLSIGTILLSSEEGETDGMYVCIHCRGVEHVCFNELR